MSIRERYARLDSTVMERATPWVYLVVPGVALHELAHAVVARRWARVSVDWTAPRVTIRWDDAVPAYALFAAFLAPLFVGGAVALALAPVVGTLPDWLAIWVIVNWLLLAGPSVVDVVALLRGLASG